VPLRYPQLDLAGFGLQLAFLMPIDRRFGFIRLPMRAVVCADVGRYRLPIDGQRDVPDQEWLRQPHPSQEAERPRYARDDAAANNAKSKIRARVEHVFAEQKHRMRLFVRTIGIARATTKIGLVNLV
jgi:hypothetical protein